MALKKNDCIVSNVEITESYYYFQGLCHAFISFVPSVGPRDVRVGERSTVIAHSFRFTAIHPLFFPRHTLPTSPHPPALGGLCALSLFNPIIHRDYSSTIRGPSPFLFPFSFFLLSQLPPPPSYPLKHCSFTTWSYLSYARYDAYLHIWFSLMSQLLAIYTLYHNDCVQKRN